MADEIIKRDENHVTVGAGVGDDADLDILMLRVDPVSKRVLATISSIGATLATASSIASRDQNHRPVCLAYDETNDTLQEVLTDENGYILCDLVIE